MSLVPTINELEDLFVNNEPLDQLAAYLNRFNPIRTMRMEKMEIRHSAILGWLLDPAETHGFADRFLKAFIAEALRGRKDRGHPTALEISQCDLRDAEVRLEWQHIDLLIISRRNGWAFVLENKFNSRQHEGQLAKYAERVGAIYGHASRPLTVQGIFLTLHDEEPEDDRYAPINYGSIVKILPRLMALEGQSLGREVETFLGQYLEIIKDATGMSENLKEMAEVARQLYLTHRKALDFIMEHGATTDFSIAVEAIFGTTPDYGVLTEISDTKYMYAWHNLNSVGFLPAAWVQAMGGQSLSWPGCEKWQAGFPIALWFELAETGDGTSGTLKLVAEVGPVTNHRCRALLIRSIERVAEREQIKVFKFQSNAAEEGRRYSRFLTRNGMVVDDVTDAAEIADTIKKLLARYKDNLESLTSVFALIREFAVVE